MSDIPKRVIDLLREVRESGQANMVDRTPVMVQAQVIRMNRAAAVGPGSADEDAAAIRWLRHNPDRYMEAVKLAGGKG